MHWYTAEGLAAHTQPTKKGAKNPFRPTNIRDAKEQKLLPSITGILSVIDNPSLNRWKMSKVAEYCFNAPPIGDEQMDEYVANALSKALDEASDAAELGTRIHSNIEHHLKGQPAPYGGPELEMALDAIDKVRSLGLDIADSEFTVVSHEYGYAGTTDLAVTKGMQCGILDFKSTKTQPGEPVTSKFGHLPQIAAYHVAHWENGERIKDNAMGYNVYISTTEPGRVEVVEYSAAQMREAFEMFCSALQIWRYKNAYDPRRS
jgi:hypothetical protein